MTMGGVASSFLMLSANKTSNGRRPQPKKLGGLRVIPLVAGNLADSSAQRNPTFGGETPSQLAFLDRVPSIATGRARETRTENAITAIPQMAGPGFNGQRRWHGDRTDEGRHQ